MFKDFFFGQPNHKSHYILIITQTKIVQVHLEISFSISNFFFFSFF